MPHLDMTIEPFSEDGLLVKLHGELDLHLAYAFDARLRRAEESDPKIEVIDLRGLSFLDSAGLSRIVAAHRRARRAKRRFVLVRPGDTVSRVLALTAMDHVFEMVRDPEAELLPA